jgi:hypothetical protein
MKQRNIPYGYAFKNGENIPHPDESKIVRRIFADYLAGKSLLILAQALTAEGVEFLPGRCDWNKSRVKRILEDTRYYGNDTYPAIIGEDIHRAGKALMRERRTVKDSNNNFNRNQSEIPFRLPCPVECACGAKMKRRCDTRRVTSQQLWTCKNPDCKRVININDEALLGEITGLLNRLIHDPSLIRISATEPDPPMEVRRLQNEVSRQIDSFDFDKDQVKADIFSLAAEKYRQADDKKIIAQMLRAEFERQRVDAADHPLSLFSPELLDRTAIRVQFDETGAAAIVLKNGQHIRKEPDHADSSNTIGTAAC